VVLAVITSIYSMFPSLSILTSDVPLSHCDFYTGNWLEGRYRSVGRI